MDNEQRNLAAGLYDAIRDGEMGVTELTEEQRELVFSEAEDRLEEAKNIIYTIKHNWHLSK